MKHPTMWAILILLLAACGASQPTVTPSLVADTPTASRVPTWTITPTITNLPTSRPKPTLDLENITFKVNYLFDYPEENILDNPYLLVSPNKKLLVNHAITLSIMNMDGEVFLEIHPSIGTEIFLGHFWSEVRWSLDSKYVFFSMVPVHPCYFCDGLGYWKLDVVTGEYIEVLPIRSQPRDGFYESLELSPNQTKLAYISLWMRPLSLFILDIETGVTQKYPLNPKSQTAGEIVWSPDGQKLIYSSSEDQFIDFNGENKFYFYLIDLDTGKQQLLTETSEIRYYIRNWEKDNVVEFSYSCQADFYDINLEKFIVETTATPLPSDSASVDYCYPTPTPTP